MATSKLNHHDLLYRGLPVAHSCIWLYLRGSVALSAFHLQDAKLLADF